MEIIIYIAMVMFFMLIALIDLRSVISTTYLQNTIKNILISIIASIYSGSLDISFSSDRENYYYWFRNIYINYDSVLDIIENNEEFGWVLLNRFITIFTTSEFWFFFIITFTITFINLQVFIHYTSDYKKVVMLYFGSLFFFSSLYLIRQSLAFTLGNVAVYNLVNDNKKYYFLLSLLAMTFHTSSIVLFFIGLLYIFRENKIIILITLFLFMISFFWFEPVFNTLLSISPLTEDYLIYDLESGGGTFGSIFRGIPYYLLTFVALLNRRYVTRYNKSINLLIVFSLIYSASFILSVHFYWFFRIGYYFLLFTLLLFIRLMEILKNKKDKFIYYITIYSSMVIITLRQMIITFY